jgi:dienelactone hydrolase
MPSDPHAKVQIPWRLGVMRVVAIMLALVSMATPVSAAGRSVTIRAEDGRTVTATLFEANHLPAPAIVLIPALGHPRDEWQVIAQRFAEQDITALTIDLPGAVLPADSAELAGWSGLVRGAVTWLSGQPNVRPTGIAVAGASLGGSLAATTAAADPRIRALALISPSIDYRGLRIEASLRQVGSRPVLFVVSRKDPYAVRSARELAKDATGRRETFFGEVASHGVPLLVAETDLARMLVDWFQRALGVN